MQKEAWQIHIYNGESMKVVIKQSLHSGIGKGLDILTYYLQGLQYFITKLTVNDTIPYSVYSSTKL